MSFSYTINRRIHDLFTLQQQIYKSGLINVSHITGTSTSVAIFFQLH